jgi:MFS family permease
MTEGFLAGRIFYGWWIVLGCGVVAVVGWSLAIFGMGVYIHVLSEQRGLSISVISTAVTFSFLVNAACLTSVGTATARLGAKPVFLTGAAAMAVSLSGLGYFSHAWGIFLMFAVLGVGRACLSATSISTTLAPWFERHQGRAVSTALLGASVGGMFATPLLLGGIAVYGVTPTFALAGAVAIILLLPISLWVIKKTPQELGLLPDGADAISTTAVEQQPLWTLKGAMATRHFQTQLLAFALAQAAQVGFLSHHVSIVARFLGESGASIAVSLAALTAFGGRIALARFADKVDLRLLTGGVMLVAAASLAYLGVSSGRFSLLLASAIYGLTIGNLTTLAPLLARREIGALSFGLVFGFISAATAFATAFGPAAYGLLRDMFDSYGPPLQVAAAVNLLAAFIIVWGGRVPLPAPR